MNLGEFREMTKDLPDNVEIEINSVWDKESQELTPSPCSNTHYSETDGKIYITPTSIALQQL